MKKFISQETAKVIALQFFGFEVPCLQAEVNCKKAWWEFNVGKIQLIVPNFYYDKKDKYPFGEIYLRGCFYLNDILDSCFGKVYLINDKIFVVSHAVGFADSGDTLAQNILFMLVPNDEIEDPEYHLSDGVKQYLNKLVQTYEKEIKDIFKLPKELKESNEK